VAEPDPGRSRAVSTAPHRSSSPPYRRPGRRGPTGGDPSCLHRLGPGGGFSSRSSSRAAVSSRGLGRRCVPAHALTDARWRRRLPFASSADTISFALGALARLIDVARAQAPPPAPSHDPGGATAYGPPSATPAAFEWIAAAARRRADQVVVTTARVRPTPSSSTSSSSRATRHRRARTTTAPAPCSSASPTFPCPSSSPMHRLRRRRKPESTPACSPSSRTSSPTSRTRPAPLNGRSAARGPSRATPDSTIFDDDPYVSISLRATRCRDAEPGPRRDDRLRPARSPAVCPGSVRRRPRRPRRLIARRQARDEPYIIPNMVARPSSTISASARARALDRTVAH